MISSFVGSGYLDKYSYEIPHEYLFGWGNLSGEKIPIKGNRQFNLGLFFQMAFPFLHIQLLFQDSFIFGEATSLLLFRGTTLTQHLLFWSSYFFTAAVFFEEVRFRNSHFLSAMIFSEYLLFRSENSTEQPLLENRKFFRAITFGNSYFSWRRSCLE